MADKTNLNLDWQHVESSNVDSIAYHPETHTLGVRFRNGGLYTYEGVDMEVYSAMRYADSVGSFLARAVKPVYPYNKHHTLDELHSHISTRGK